MAEKDRDYSVAEAKSRLPALIHEVEAGEAVHISRRGRAAAVLISAAEYARLRSTAERTPLGAAVRAWRGRTAARVEPGEMTPETVRDHGAGRDVDLG